MGYNVNVVPKEINPPNEPRASQIGNFRVCLAQKVYEGGSEVKTKQLLIRRIEFKMKKFDTHFVQSLLDGVKA